VPSDRGRRTAPVVPRWITDPRVLDWVTSDEVLCLVEEARERAAEHGGTRTPVPVLSPEESGQRFAWMAAYSRFIAALDIAYGVDAWPSSWTSAPWEWEPAPGAPPADLVAAVCVARTRPAGQLSEYQEETGT
jgi:hypothetical protein